MSRIWGGFAALALGLTVLFASCGKPTGDNDERLDLVAGRDKIPADGTSTTVITAFVKDAAGDPVKEGVVVFFETTEGKVDPAAVAVANGLAATTLTSSLNPGLVVVRASTEEGLNETIDIEFTAATADTISLNCEPNIIPADGDSQSSCSADVRLPSGDPVPNGTDVLFTTTAGTLSASSVDTVNGRATVTLRSTTTGATATVVARSGTADDVFRVTFSPNPPNRVIVRATPERIPADGTSQSIITVSVFLANGDVAPDGTQVTCVTDGGDLTAGTLSTTNGTATTILVSEEFPGSALVTCTSGTGRGNARVRFICDADGPPESIDVDVARTTIGVPREQTTVTATVFSGSGCPLPGVRVDFFLENTGAEDATVSPERVTTNADGEAVTTLQSGLRAGTVVVVAESGGVEGESPTVVIEPDAPNDMTLDAPASITEPAAAGSATGTVSAFVTDRFGNPVEDGTRVGFSIVCPDGGNGDTCANVGISPTTALTSAGVATATLTVTRDTPETSVRVTARASGGATPEQFRIVTINQTP